MAPVLASCGLNVGKCEVPAFEQKGLQSSFRQRVNEAVTEVQPCRMVALAESPPSPARGLRMVSGNRRQLDPPSFQDAIKLRSGCGSKAAFENDCRLQETSGRHAAMRSLPYRPRVSLGVRLIKQDRQDRRRVDYHFGNPRSS